MNKPSPASTFTPAPPPPMAARQAPEPLDIEAFAGALDASAKASEPIHRLHGRPEFAALATARLAAAEARRAVDELFFPSGRPVGRSGRVAQEAACTRAKDALAAAELRVKQLLAVGAGDPAIESAEFGVSRARRAVDRESLKLQSFPMQEEAARQAVLEEAWTRFYPGYASLLNDSVAALRTAADLQKQLRMLGGFAGAEFENVTGFLPFPDDYLLNGAHVKAFAADVDSAIAAEARRGKGVWR